MIGLKVKLMRLAASSMPSMILPMRSSLLARAYCP